MVLFPAAKNDTKRVLQNQVQIDFDNENDDFCDENCNNFDVYGDENDQKTDKYHGLLVKLLGKKKDQNNRAGVNPLPPQTGNAHLK